MKRGSKKENIQALKAWILIGVLAIIFIVIIGIMLKYQVEGEKNMPFYLSEMSVISTAEGIEQEAQEGEEWWSNLIIHQNNDIYLKIKKDEEHGKDQTIQKVAIENLQVTKAPQKGTVQAYMPNSTEGRTFVYDEQYQFIDKLTFQASSKTEPQNLEIGNQGGVIRFRVSNLNLGTYQAKEEGDLTHNGTILKKIDTKTEEVQFDLAFDLAIYMRNKVYRTNLTLTLPTGYITEEGITHIEKKDLSDLVYKRYRK